MQLEQQVCSLELAQKLKELGVKQESLFRWRFTNDFSIKKGFKFEKEVQLKPVNPHDTHFGVYSYISAFTVAELGELIPYWLDIEGSPQIVCYGQGKTIQAVDMEKNEIVEYQGKLLEWKAYTEADARAKMLVYLLENKLINL